MSRLGLQLLNFAFFAVHSCIVVFNVVGWAFPRTRKANLVLLLLTLFSWLAMGAIYGIGYCVCTDWHFAVRRALGYHDRGDSYIAFLVWKITGVLPPSGMVRTFTGVIFVACLLLSCVLNWRDWRRRSLR